MADFSALSTGVFVPLALTPPNGLEEIHATFGDILEYIHADGTLDPGWQTDVLARAQLPFAVKLSWDTATSVNQITCHKRLVKLVVSVFAQVQSKGLQEKIVSFGGCFSYRSERASRKLSTHAWGIAIDLNPETNPQGLAGDMDPSMVEIFRGAGFTWGGDWDGARRDPMHFQFCTGY